MKKRILIVSDMHYTTDITPEEMEKTNPSINVSAAAGDAFGYTQKQKIDRIVSDILKENEKEKLDMVLVLGDLSIDDYSFRNLEENYCKKFKEDCMDKLPCPVYAIPGNHDSYPNDMWKKAVGTDRQFVIDCDNFVFLMMDNFNNSPADSASGSKYTPTDVEWLKDKIEKYSNKKLLLCAHMFRTNETETDEFKKIVRETDNIVALFRGHTHIDEVIDFEGKPLIDIGGYAYKGFCIDDEWIFSIFDPKWAWGYQMLEIEDEKITTWHVKPPIFYRAQNGDFDFEETSTEKMKL